MAGQVTVMLVYESEQAAVTARSLQLARYRTEIVPVIPRKKCTEQ